MTTQPLAELATISDLETAPPARREREAPRVNSFVLWGFIVMLIGVAVGVVGKKLLHADIITVVGVLISLVGMFLSAYPFIAPPRRKKNEASPASQPKVLTPSQPTEYLPPGSNIDYVPSITERTTDLLKESAAKPVQKENEESEAMTSD